MIQQHVIKIIHPFSICADPCQLLLILTVKGQRWWWWWGGSKASYHHCHTETNSCVTSTPTESQLAANLSCCISALWEEAEARRNPWKHRKGKNKKKKKKIQPPHKRVQAPGTRTRVTQVTQWLAMFPALRPLNCILKVFASFKPGSSDYRRRRSSSFGLIRTGWHYY